MHRIAVGRWRDHADPTRGRSIYVLQANGHFWADEARVFAEYTATRAEAAWPTWFRNLVVVALAAEVADFCQLNTKAREYRAQAGRCPV